MECLNGCGFFGSAETRNMCSKCFKDFVKTQATSNKPISAVDRSADGKRAPLFYKVPEITEKLSTLITTIERRGGNELLARNAAKVEVFKITARSSDFIEVIRRGDETMPSGNKVEVDISEITAIISKLTSLVDWIGDEKLVSGIDGSEEVSESTEKMECKKKKKKKNRCECCKKKVGLLGFRCRCGRVFCSQHRMPELHTCNIDYKETNGSNTNSHLALVKANKLEFRI